MEIWHLLQHGPGAPAGNMAADEALWRTARRRDRPLLRLYGWDRPAVSFGYFLKYPAALADRYALVRRPTGGGIVYHDADTTYTVVVPAGQLLHRLKTQDAYCAIHQAIAVALQLPASISQLPHSPRGQYECFQNPVTGDVVAGDRKLAGGAQRRGKAGLLHQGSIAGHVPAARLIAGFAEVFAVEFAPYELSPAERALADKLAAEKYGAADWNQRVR